MWRSTNHPACWYIAVPLPQKKRYLPSRWSATRSDSMYFRFTGWTDPHPVSCYLHYILKPQKKPRNCFKPAGSGKNISRWSGDILPGQGTIDHPVKKIKDRYIRQKIDPDKNSSPAVTDYKCLGKIELPVSVDKYPTSRYSLAELSPKTGRRHQLRQHMKHLSHPIIGDTRYGKDIHNKFFLTRFNCKGLLPAAVELHFLHPKNRGRSVDPRNPGPGVFLDFKTI